jgi:membrane protein required for colicin V production
VSAIPAAFNGLDWALVAVIGLSMVSGIRRGAVSQVFGILGVGAGFFLALNYYLPFSARLAGAFKGLPRPGLVALSVLFLLAWFAFGVVGYWLSQFVRKRGLNVLDRVLGALVGLIKAVVLSVVIVSALVFFFSPKDPLIGRSHLAPYLQEMAGVMVRAAPSGVQLQFERKRKEFLEFWLGQQEALTHSAREMVTG